MDEDCSICGLELKEKFCYELKCGHKFHYECLMKSFMNIPKPLYIIVCFIHFLLL